MPSTVGIVASGAPSFSPLDLSPALWLDAADTATITASGGSVSQWDNKGSLGNFTQGTGAAQPTTGASTLNGLNVIDFAGDYVTAANTNEWKFLNDGTIWFLAGVFKAGIVANPNAALGLVGSNGASSGNIGYSVFFDDRSSLGRNNRITNQISHGAGASSVFSTSANDFFSPDQHNVLTAYFDPTNAVTASRSSVRVNADAALDNNSATSTPASTNPSFALQIGATGNNAIPLTGSVAELVIVSGANATASNLDLVRDYLNGKWAVY